jgi:LEA14-like dessication related protein
MGMGLWRALALLAAAGSAAAPLSIRVVPETDDFTVVASGTGAPSASGAFTGTLSLNGSPSELPVSGVARSAADRTEVSLKIRYRDVPEDWVNRFRANDFDYKLRGTVAGGSALSWSGTRRWADIEVQGRKEAASSFVQLGQIALTQFSLLESAARAEVTVRNPLSFPVKLAGAEYRLEIDGREVGAGTAPGTLLRPNQSTTLNLPIDLDHGQLLAAAGSALASGGEVTGHLRGTLTIRLPGGDVPVPLDMSGHFSAAR